MLTCTVHHMTGCVRIKKCCKVTGDGQGRTLSALNIGLHTFVFVCVGVGAANYCIAKLRLRSQSVFPSFLSSNLLVVFVFVNVACVCLWRIP